MLPDPSKSPDRRVSSESAPFGLEMRRKIAMRNAGFSTTSDYSTCHELLCERIRNDGFVPSRSVTFAVQAVCHPMQKTPVPIECEKERLLLGETRVFLERLQELSPGQRQVLWKYLVDCAARYPALSWYLHNHVRYGLGFTPYNVDADADVVDSQLIPLIIEIFSATPMRAAQLSLDYWVSCESNEVRIFNGKRDRAALLLSPGLQGVLAAPAGVKPIVHYSEPEVVASGPSFKTAKTESAPESLVVLIGGGIIVLGIVFRVLRLIMTY